MTKRRDTDELLGDVDGLLGDVAHMSVAEAKQARTAGAVDRVIQTATPEHTCDCQMSFVPDRVTFFSRDAESADPGRWFWREDATQDTESAWLPCYNISRDDATGACLAARTGDRIRPDDIGPDYWDVQQLFLDDLETYGAPPEPDVKYEGYKWLIPEKNANQRGYVWNSDVPFNTPMPPVQVQRGPVTFNPPPPTFTWHDYVAAIQPEQVEQIRALNPGHPAFDPDSWALFDGANREEVNPGVVSFEVVEEDGDNPVVETYENSDGSTTTIYRFGVPDDPLPF